MPENMLMDDVWQLSVNFRFNYLYSLKMLLGIHNL